MPRGGRGLAWQVEAAVASSPVSLGDGPLMPFYMTITDDVRQSRHLRGEFRVPDGRPVGLYEHLGSGIFVADTNGAARSPTFSGRPNHQLCRWHVLRIVLQAPPQPKLTKCVAVSPDDVSS